MAWSLQDAEQRFGDVVRQAETEGPQHITRQGEDVAVVLSASEYHRLTRGKHDFSRFPRSAPERVVLDRRPEHVADLRDFLLNGGPDLSKLDLERVKDYPRDVEL